jgi:hypothetical protein
MSRYALLWETGENTVLHSVLILDLPMSPPIAAAPPAEHSIVDPAVQPIVHRAVHRIVHRIVHKERAEQLDPEGLGLLGPSLGHHAWRLAWGQAWQGALRELGCAPARLRETTCALRPAAPRWAPAPPAIDITALLHAPTAAA